MLHAVFNWPWDDHTNSMSPVLHIHSTHLSANISALKITRTYVLKYCIWKFCEIARRLLKVDRGQTFSLQNTYQIVVHSWSAHTITCVTHIFKHHAVAHNQKRLPFYFLREGEKIFISIFIFSMTFGSWIWWLLLNNKQCKIKGCRLYSL